MVQRFGYFIHNQNAQLKPKAAAPVLEARGKPVGASFRYKRVRLPLSKARNGGELPEPAAIKPNDVAPPRGAADANLSLEAL
jgi:hypothetical protein